MIRILIVEPAGGLWGSERALLDLIEAVPHLEIAVCCPPQTRLEAELKKRGVCVLPHFIAGLPNTRSSDEARRCGSVSPLNQGSAARNTSAAGCPDS